MQLNSRQQTLRMILLGKDEVEMEVFKEEDEAAKPENDIIEENEWMRSLGETSRQGLQESDEDVPDT